MHRKVFRCIAFMLIFIVLWSSFTRIMINKNRNQNSAANPEAEGAEVVFVGTSQSALGINPLVMWDSCGIKAYNFSGNGQYIGTTYYVLKEIFNHMKPRVVALDIRSVVIPEDFLVSGNLLFNSTVVSNVYLRYQVYDSFIKEDLIYFLNLLRYHERWKEISQEDFQNKQYVLGAELHAENKINEWPVVESSEEEVAIGEDELFYLNEIVKLLEDNECICLFFRMPGTYDTRCEGKVQSVINYAKEHNIKFYDFMSEEFIKGSGLQVEDFRDGNHLNVEGADKLSALLGQYMIEDGYVTARYEDGEEWGERWTDDRKELDSLHFQVKSNFESYYSQICESKDYMAVLIIAGNVEESALRKVEEMLGISIVESGEKVFWMEGGQWRADNIINIIMDANNYELSIKHELFISCVTGEISINNESVCKISNGFNIIVYDKEVQRIVNIAGFDSMFERKGV